jgi:hypothetical protein
MATGKQVLVGPNFEIHHPDYGDMTAEVARELQAMNQQQDDQVYLEADARQRTIARVAGREAVHGRGGMRLVAQIDESVYNYWELREGREFWKHEISFMLKRHPELAVKSMASAPTIGFGGTAGQAAARTGVRGKRGRWAA